MSFYEDTEFVYRMLEKSDVAYTDRNISIYEQDGQGLSASLHPVEKEMAYYVPEIIEKLNPGFWYMALLYENIELTKLWWQNNPEILAFYNNMHLMIEYSERAVVFTDGEVVASDNPSAILTDDSLLEKASLKRTSLSDLASLTGIDETLFTRRFISYDRKVRK